MTNKRYKSFYNTNLKKKPTQNHQVTFISVCHLVFWLLGFFCASNSSSPFSLLHMLVSKEISLVSKHCSFSPFKVEWSIKCTSSEEQGTSNFTKEPYTSHNLLHLSIPNVLDFSLDCFAHRVEVCIELLHVLHIFTQIILISMCERVSNYFSLNFVLVQEHRSK